MGLGLKLKRISLTYTFSGFKLKVRELLLKRIPYSYKIGTGYMASHHTREPGPRFTPQNWHITHYTGALRDEQGFVVHDISDRLQAIALNVTRQLFPGRFRVLELGAGSGVFFHNMHPDLIRRADWEMLDINTQCKETALARNPQATAYHLMNAENLDIPDHQFDLVTDLLFLNATSDLNQVLKEARRVLKPKGYIFSCADGGPTFGVTRAYADRLGYELWRHPVSVEDTGDLSNDELTLVESYRISAVRALQSFAPIADRHSLDRLKRQLGLSADPFSDPRLEVVDFYRERLQLALKNNGFSVIQNHLGLGHRDVDYVLAQLN